MTQSFQFHYGPRVLSGEGSSRQAAELLASSNVLFITDANVRALGLADAALEALRDQQAKVTIFDEVEADPSLPTLLRSVEAGRSAGATAVIGFGGGSPMDVAKLTAYLLGSGDDVDGIWGVDNAVGHRLPLVLVTTTAGTGSEATPVAVITVNAGEKKGASSTSLTADWAILDAGLTVGLPRDVTAATGLDAMVHAIEAYTSARLKNPLSDMLARQALALMWPNLQRACDEPGDLDARSAMLLGAHLAGVAFANAPVAGVHALAYPLGGHFHVPHGVSNALMLTHVLGHNMDSAARLYAELGVLIDPSLASATPEKQARGLVGALGDMCRRTGLPRRLSEVGVTAGELDLLASEAMKQERLLVNNPCPITKIDARRLYEAAL